MYARGTSRNGRRAHRIAVAALLAGAAAVPLGCAASAQSQTSPADPYDPNRTIVVTGYYRFHDLRAERNLDQQGIDGYGVSTIDELVGEVQGELGDPDEQPLILVNGERINDLSEIGALPVEALRNVHVLPRGSAVRLGGSSGQRVLSLSLKKELASETLTAARKQATDGDWHGNRGEAIFTRIHGPTRVNVALRGRNETSLFESDRGIEQPLPRLPYALGGAVTGFPAGFTSEVDPALSALAGSTVYYAPIPATGAPTLADFANQANQLPAIDLGDFRTLRPELSNYELNGSFNTRLAPWLTSTAALRFSRNISRSQRGLATGLFVLPDENPASPFSRDVNLAYYRPEPLRSRSRRQGAEANLTLNGTFGTWTGNFNAKHTLSKDASTSERSQFGTTTLDDSINPFTTDLSGLIEIRRDQAVAHRTGTLTQLSLTGPAITLPAGPAIATVEGRMAWNRVRSDSSFALVPGEHRFHRSEQWARASVDVPITSRAQHFGDAIGDLSATAEYSRVHFSDAGSLGHYGLGLTWEPVPILRLRGSIEQTEAPAAIETLGNPVIVVPDVRMFDPLTGETVDVTQISGGNPDLSAEKLRIKRLTALLRLVPKLNLQLNAEYTDTDRRNFISSLPEASAAITLAFPDRFVRDINGVLTTVDLRAVNFDSDREKRFRWGFSMNARLDSGNRGKPRSGAVRRPPTSLQLIANHTVVFSDEIRIRGGLDPVDLLQGGAIGIGGGRLRHQLDGSASITSGGLGLRMGANWRGASGLQARVGTTTDTLRFSPVVVLNLRTFAEGQRILPRTKWAKGFRISLDVLNLLNDRQSVRNSVGETPLQYQPGYRDPVGRTIEIEIRKVF